ncbi:MAG TPA: FMN-binding negative transcriptional regulator [Betaproteobacteria bacterium]|nr:FMN-binding negative transcriptional regulator [Betaproteobacteria bacterium]
MYTPPHFEERNTQRLAALIDAYPFGVLVSTQAGRPLASHLPFLFDPAAGVRGRLFGHMARANAQWRDWSDGQTVLVIFQGPHAYVSPAWCDTPGVPTWNYAVVHLYGVPRLIEDAAQIEALLVRQTAVHEARYPSPWQPDLTAAQRQRLLKAVVGFEIDVVEMQGKFKLSQNRPHDDRQRIIAQLAQTAYPLEKALSDLMRANCDGER